MPAICYKDKKFRQPSLEIIGGAQEIISEYQAEGFTLTLRQLYYQFVARDWMENKQSEYDRLGGIINDARLAGYIDWDAIEDRTRFLRSNSHWNSTTHALDTVAQQYAIDKWADQPCRVEVWIEKDALIGVIEEVCESNDVPYFACRGYTSQSEAWRAAQRALKHIRNGQHVTILHLGDHDPSGIDMTRDIFERFKLFLLHYLAFDFNIHRIALNMRQVEEHRPPPNFAKLSDSRAKSYIAKYGRSSWELDALDPRQIESLIRTEIESLRDPDLWQSAVDREQEGKDRLHELKIEEEENNG